MVYDIATFRRPSMIAREEAAANVPPGTFVQQLPPPPPMGPMGPMTPQSPHSLGVPSVMDSPVTPAPDSFEIDDEFNLPISVAFTILLLYMLCGAALYAQWEDWGFFNAFYFVFISMSTIGFGDLVPRHPIFMMMSIIYLVFGLALTSMCINVIQAKLSDHFRHASAKIGATIGLSLAEEEAARQSAAQTPQVELGTVEVTVPQQQKPQTNGPPPLPQKPVPGQGFDFSRPTVPTRRKSTVEK